jgi:hypothetical protein
MRQITKEAVNKFLQGENYNKNNTQVWSGYECSTQRITKLFLHGNLIAQRSAYGQTIITNAGWFSNTTKERLNGLLDLFGYDKIYQKKFKWYLMDKVWNGNPVKLLKHNTWEYV